jgi:hypothetical protein
MCPSSYGSGSGAPKPIAVTAKGRASRVSLVDGCKQIQYSIYQCYAHLYIYSVGTTMTPRAMHTTVTSRRRCSRQQRATRMTPFFRIFIAIDATASALVWLFWKISKSAPKHLNNILCTCREDSLIFVVVGNRELQQWLLSSGYSLR